MGVLLQELLLLCLLRLLALRMLLLLLHLRRLLSTWRHGGPRC